MTTDAPAPPPTAQPKKGPSKKVIAGAAVVVLVAIAAVGGGGKTPAPAAPGNTGGNAVTATQGTTGGVTARLNTPYSLEGVTITIKEVQTSPGGEFLKPAAGNVYVGYLVNIAATEENRFVNISDWTALADGTKQGQWTIASVDSWEPALGFDQIRNGASVEGWITFEVPKPSSFVRLVYDPSFFSGEAKLTLDATVE